MVSSRRRPEYAPSQYALGLMYATGRGLPQDHVEAMRWYRLAAEQGFAPAQASLGVLYSSARTESARPVAGMQVWLAVAQTRANLGLAAARDRSPRR